MTHDHGRRSARFAFIDGLRGLAALAVLCFHFYNQILADGKHPELITPLHELVRHGDLGVEIFFVLSGFVIAYSIRGARVTGRYFGNFALRRSLRLDPPYWLVIFLSYALLRVAGSMGESHARVPGALGVLANLLYLDNLLGAPSLVKVGWTLCLEVQFYLVLIALVAATQVASPERRKLARLAVFAPIVLYALAVQVGWMALPRPGLFIEYWAMFFLGVLTWWTLAGENDVKVWLGFAVVVAPVALAGHDLRLGVALAAASAILVAGRTDRLTTALDHPAAQYLGRISYSLYLMHPLVGHTAIKWLQRHHALPGALGGLALFVIALALAVLAAHLLHVWVEQPSVRFSHRLRRPENRVIAAAHSPH